MIEWKFKCNNCGYKFRATEPIELYKNYNECSQCKSKNIVKSIIVEKGVNK